MNRIKLSGTVISKPEITHESRRGKFYVFFLESLRSSGVADVLKCIISEDMVRGIDIGIKLEICGEIRTRNIKDENGSHLVVEVFVFNIFNYSGKDENEVELHGFICKQPLYRTTPKGREITDFIIASNRNQKKSDYIPCIAWEANARNVERMDVGTELNIVGRLQRREYQKRISETEYETRQTIELSVSKIEVVGKEEVNGCKDNDGY